MKILFSSSLSLHVSFSFSGFDCLFDPWIWREFSNKLQPRVFSWVSAERDQTSATYGLNESVAEGKESLVSGTWVIHKAREKTQSEQEKEKKKASGSTFKASSCYVWWSYICEFEQLNWKQQLWLLERGQSATSLKSTGMTGWPGFMLKAFFSQLTGKCYLEQYNTDYIHATQSTTANTGVLQLQLWDVSLFVLARVKML